MSQIKICCSALGVFAAWDRWPGLALLQGLMDTDGTVSKVGQCSFSTTSEKLRDGMFELLCCARTKTDSANRRGKRFTKPCGPAPHQFWPHPRIPVFRLKRKVARQSKTRWKRASYRQIVSADLVESVQCGVSKSIPRMGTFLVGRSMIPTHNSTLSSGGGDVPRGGRWRTGRRGVLAGHHA